uniref:non-specific serine/threonine protein kinase n=1 Tax=Romanomermis culicivorax TaxID=13658 RepID=A0A915J656_ROMCU
MKFSADDVLEFRHIALNGRSPTELILDVWSSRLHTVDNLALLLAKIEAFSAVDAISTLIKQETKGQIDVIKEKFRADQAAIKGKVVDIKIEENRLHISSSNERRDNDRTDLRRPSLPNELSKKCRVENSVPVKKPSLCSIDPIIAMSLHNTLRISLSDLSASTDNFALLNILGHGGYGVVYKGVWKHTKVAIKRLGVMKCSNGQVKRKSSASATIEGFKQSVAELKTLAMCRHDNIVALYGYCFEEPEYCIVYQFMSGGSLDDHLFCKTSQKVLTWSERLKIARGALCGINYLHTSSKEPLIHGDIKPANILLDSTLEAKLGDFGLCRRGFDESSGSPMIASHIKGTLAYLPPEFIRSKLVTTKLDIFSFGVVFFEMATGLRSYSDFRKPSSLVDYIREKRDFLINEQSSSSLSNLEQYADKKLTNDNNKDIFNKFLQLGFKATSQSHENRPCASILIDQLDGSF